MKKGLSLWVLTFLMIFITACKENIPTEEEIIIPACSYEFSMTKGDMIPVLRLDLPYSTSRGDIENFINPCKPEDVNPITLIDSSIRTHQLIFTFDAIYPLDSMQIISDITSLSVEVSLDTVSFDRILSNQTLTSDILDLGGTMAKAVKLVIPLSDDDIKIDDIRFKLDEGLIIQEDEDLTRQFLRYNGWTGADGIFTFNLTNGDETIGAEKSTVGFIFSDTFVGEVYPNNNLRKTSIMINNSLGYLDTSKPIDEAISFAYGMAGITPVSPYIPDAYIGLKGRNLLDGDGLSISQSEYALFSNSSEGLSYRANSNQAEILIDLKEAEIVDKIVIWNDNSNPNMGAKDILVSFSEDKINFTTPSPYLLDKASGSANEPYTLKIDDLHTHARYIKIELVSSYDSNYVGLGKLMIFNDEEQFLFGEVTASPSVDTLMGNELTSRLWLQDGVVINDKLYIFPILVKDEGEAFKVHNVGLIETPIINERMAFEQANYYSTPLQVKTEDGGTIFFGAGLMNNTARDGYIYIYGYKDLAGRHLVVGRFLPEDILNFNAWTYFNGDAFVHDINQVQGLISKVSAELSVTYMPSGMYAGKYMLTVMEDTTSGKISYAISDTPYGTFSEYINIYETNVSHLRGAFTYNAKLHPALSKPGEYIVSYNVNTTQLGALSDARIYYPRFIKIIEVKE